MRYFILILILLIATTVNAGEYKSLGTLYPELTKELELPDLGETKNGDRVIAEAKHPKANLWVQFIDCGCEKELDDNCDYVIQIELHKGKLHLLRFDCMRMLETLMRYCQKNGILLQDLIHFAEPLKLKPTIQPPETRAG